MIYELKFTEQEMQVLNMALGEIPYKFSAPLVQAINRQIMEAKPVSGEEPPTPQEPAS